MIAGCVAVLEAKIEVETEPFQVVGLLVGRDGTFV
jgi:hypothetical protein